MNINILSIEAKDLFIGEEGGNFGSPKEFKISKNKKYKATLDYSLETIKLKEIHEKVYRNKKFTFIKNDKLYTDDIISISFNYKLKNISTSVLREILYANGFKCNNHEYVRYKRSSGSSRIGKCLFIKKKMFNKMAEWSYMGLKYKIGEPIDLASIEAYISLTTSSIINTIDIEPNNILVIDDYESKFRNNVMVTKIGEDNKLITTEEEVDIYNSIWDGQSLLDVSLFEKKYTDDNGIDKNYKNKGMLLLRNRFFKSCCFNTNIQQFFTDNNITDVKQLKGWTLAKNISDIKMITTPSSIKYLKFGSMEEYMSRLEKTFGIVKYDKPTHYFYGNMVQTHYQLLNTLELSKEDTEVLLEDTLEYVRRLKQDIPTLRMQLKMNIDNDFEVSGVSSTNDFVYTMLQLNDDIKNTSMFVKFRTDLVNSYVKNIRKGHILIKGNYSVIMGNGFEMLKASIGQFDETSSIPVDCICSKNFFPNEELLGIRSPHVTMGNLWLVKNIKRFEYDKYFNLSKQIMCINSIKNNVLERLNGCDFDSDSLMLTNNKLLIKKAKENYAEFLVPTSNVTSKKAERLNNSFHRYDLDKKTSVNKIGEIINLSQVLNSYLWELKKQGLDYSEVYKDISKLAVMSCIEIDKAKKEFVVDNSKELEYIREKYSEEIKKKPMFFYYLPTDKKFKISKTIEKYRWFETTMDYLEKIINVKIRKIKAPKQNRIPLSELIVSGEKVSLTNANTSQANKIIEMCRDLKVSCAKIWASEIIEGAEKYSETNILKSEYIKKLKRMKVNSDTIKYILLELDSNIQRKMMSSLFESHREEFIKVFNEKAEAIETLKYDKKGDIKIYGMNYKIYKKLQFQG